MQGNKCTRQGLGACKVNGPWLKQVWSFSRMEKAREWSRQLLLRCDFLSREWAGWTCRQTKTKVKDSSRVNPHWHHITNLTKGAARAVEVHYLTQTCPHFFVITVRYYLCCSHQPLNYNLKFPPPNVDIGWPGKAADVQKSAYGLFGIHFCCLRLAACLHQRKRKSFQVTNHGRLFPGLCPLPRPGLNALFHHHVELIDRMKNDAAGKHVLMVQLEHGKAIMEKFEMYVPTYCWNLSVRWTFCPVGSHLSPRGDKLHQLASLSMAYCHHPRHSSIDIWSLLYPRALLYSLVCLHTVFFLLCKHKCLHKGGHSEYFIWTSANRGFSLMYTQTNGRQACFFFTKKKLRVWL